MSVFNGFLQGREDDAVDLGSAVLPQRWMTTGRPPEERLALFDAWVERQLVLHIDWTWAHPHQVKRIKQCRAELERLVLELWRRGWMLDGRRLGAHLVGVLERIGRYQRDGKVADFWPYFQATVRRYVGLNAEEIRQESLQVGAHINLCVQTLTKPVSAPSLPELVAQRAQEAGAAKQETLREKLARQRRLQAERNAAADQPQLF
jgi:hypothetical protein